MAYGPAELGIQQQDQRPYGSTAQELIDQRNRRMTEAQGAPAQPLGGDTTGPAPQPPTPGPALRTGTSITPEQRGDRSLQQIDKQATNPSDNVPQWPSDVQNSKGSFGDTFGMEQPMVAPSRVTHQVDQNPVGNFTQALTSARNAIYGAVSQVPVLGGLQEIAQGIVDRGPLSTFVFGKNPDFAGLQKGTPEYQAALNKWSEDTGLGAAFIEGEAAKVGVKAIEHVTQINDLQGVADRLRAIGQHDAASGVQAQIDHLSGKSDPFVEIDPKTGKPTPETTDVTPAAKPVTPEGITKKTLQTPGKVSPFESRTPAAAGVTKAEARPPITMPTVENLGIPKHLLDQATPAVKDRLTRIAQENYRAIQEQRRGVLTVPQIKEWGQQLGVDTHMLSQTAPGTAVTPEGWSALTGTLDDLVNEGNQLEAQIREAGPLATEEMKARLATNLYENAVLQKTIAGVRAEWGRTGVMMQEAGAAGKRTDFYSRVLKAVGGAENIDKVTQAIADIRSDPTILNEMERRARTLKFISQLPEADNWDKINEARVNGLISNVHNHTDYMIGQTTAQVLGDIVTTLPKTVLGGIRTLGGRAGGEVKAGLSFTGAVGRYVGTAHGLADAMQAAGFYIRTGVSRSEIRRFGEEGATEFRTSLKGSAGAVLTFPSRAIETYTTFFHEWGRTASLYEQAFDKVAKEGKINPFSPQFNEEVSHLINNPTQDMEKLATKAGKDASMRGKPENVISNLLDQARNVRLQDIPGLHWTRDGIGVGDFRTFKLGGFKPGQMLLPFLNISFNRVRLGLQWSPLGTLMAIGETGVKRDEVLARSAVGWATSAYFWHLADQGNLTGALPDDPNERAQFYRDGKQPYSIKIGNDWVDFSKFEPITFGLRWVAGLYDIKKQADKKGGWYNQDKGLNTALIEDSAGKALGVMGHGFLDGNWSIVFNQIAQAVQYGDPGTFIGQTAASYIPGSGFLRTVAQSTDPYIRSARGIIQQVEATIPGLSALVPASMTAYGEKNRRPDSQQGFSGVLNPIRSSPSHPDPVDQELSGLTIPPIDPSQTTTKQIFATMAKAEIATFTLTNEEGLMLQTLAGRATHQQLTELFADQSTYNGKKYSELGGADKVKAVQKVMTDARATARAATADAIMAQAKTPEEVSRAATMRLSIVTTRYDRAVYLGGLEKQGKLSPAAIKTIDQYLGKSPGPTASEYLKVAPAVAEYLAAPPFDQGNPDEWAQLKDQRAQYSALQTADKIHGTNDAPAYYKDHPLLRKYLGQPESADRRRLLNRNKDLASYVSGATYVQER